MTKPFAAVFLRILFFELFKSNIKSPFPSETNEQTKCKHNRLSCTLAEFVCCVRCRDSTEENHRDKSASAHGDGNNNATTHGRVLPSTHVQLPLSPEEESP